MKFLEVNVHIPEIAKKKIEDFAEYFGFGFDKAVEIIMTAGWKTICEKAKETGFSKEYIYGKEN